MFDLLKRRGTTRSTRTDTLCQYTTVFRSEFLRSQHRLCVGSCPGWGIRPDFPEARPRRERCAPKAEGSSAVTRPARRVDVARRKLALRTDVVRHGNPTPRAALPRTKVSMADRADLAAPLGASGEIGRASWRERVCKYV